MWLDAWLGRPRLSLEASKGSSASVKSDPSIDIVCRRFPAPKPELSFSARTRPQYLEPDIVPARQAAISYLRSSKPVFLSTPHIRDFRTFSIYTFQQASNKPPKWVTGVSQVRPSHHHPTDNQTPITIIILCEMTTEPICIRG